MFHFRSMLACEGVTFCFDSDQICIGFGIEAKASAPNCVKTVPLSSDLQQLQMKFI